MNCELGLDRLVLDKVWGQVLYKFLNLARRISLAYCYLKNDQIKILQRMQEDAFQRTVLGVILGSSNKQGLQKFASLQ